MLMANLSNSMYETLKSTNPEIEPLDPGTLNALATKFAGTDANVAGLKLDEVPSTVFGTPSNSTAAIQVTPGSASVGDVSKKRDRDEKKVLSIAKFRNLDQDLVTDSDPERGGSRLNKRHSKHRTKRISYIKHKQTRKNHHSRKTNKNSNATCNYTFPIT